MSVSARRLAALTALAIGLALVAACESSDPLEDALRQRARWNVQLLGWSETSQQTILMEFRLSGPPNSRLDQYTVRIDLVGADDQVLAERWHTFDLTQVPRGGPKDVVLSVPAADETTEGLALQIMPRPTPEQVAKMPELP